MRQEFEGWSLEDLQFFRKEASETKLWLGAFEFLGLMGTSVVCAASRDLKTGVICTVSLATGLIVSEGVRKLVGREIEAVQEAIQETIDN